MRARTLAIALLCLIATPPPARPANLAGATLVLRLPLMVSADQVRGLIADLRGKGAQLMPSPPPKSASPHPISPLQLASAAGG
jgi:hypothetical protein